MEPPLDLNDYIRLQRHTPNGYTATELNLPRRIDLRQKNGLGTVCFSCVPSDWNSFGS
jgi:hypothetical protein